ncbi:NAD(+)/NADH kinase [Dermabacteraceae bacterium TAE3-ERU27]|nr:NAD(+)/NADH kinase [Dermabacteraceae bacterium TAE3-ERU27]
MEFTQRVAVVLNPVKPSDPKAFRDRVRELCAEAEIAEPKFFETTVSDPGATQARQALAEGFTRILAVGGDGTVRAVAGEVARSGAILGIVPLGTGNLLARNLGLPIDDTLAALRIALFGQPGRVDVGWLRHGLSALETHRSQPELFLVMAGFGFDAAIMESTDSGLKKRVGWLAYVVAGVRKVTGRSHRVLLRLDDKQRFTRQARTVLIGNVGKLPAGINLLPEAKPDSGSLQILVAAWRGFAGLSEVASNVLTASKKRFHRASKTDFYTAHRLEVITASPLPVQIDGDTAGSARGLIAEIEAGALLVAER